MGSVSIRLPDPCLVVLVGAAGAGKSTWAGGGSVPAASSSPDHLRGIVGPARARPAAPQGRLRRPRAHRAKRLKRKLTTVLDSTGLEAPHRAKLVALAARRRACPCIAVVFDCPNGRPGRATGRASSRCRRRSSPRSSRVRRGARCRSTTRASRPSPSSTPTTPGRARRAPLPRRAGAARRQQEDPVPLTFGLQIGRFAFPGGAAELAPRLADFARTAEDVGFTSISVMDHLVQIPQIGPEWEDMPESWTTLGYLAGATRTAHARRARHATSACATSPTWQDRRHRRRALGRPGVVRPRRRLVRAGDAALRLSSVEPPARRGSTGSRTRSSCCRCCGARGRRPSRAARSRRRRRRATRGRSRSAIPILVGGGGEKRTLRLVAEHADACNLFGEPADVAAKLDVLRRHCEDVGRDPVDDPGHALRRGRRARRTARRAVRRRRRHRRGADRPLPRPRRGRRRARHRRPAQRRRAGGRRGVRPGDRRVQVADCGSSAARGRRRRRRPA